MGANKSTNNNTIFAFIAISMMMTCGIILPVWLAIGIIVLILRKVSPPPEQKPQVVTPVVIMPSNEFADEWCYQIYSIDESTNGE